MPSLRSPSLRMKNLFRSTSKSSGLHPPYERGLPIQGILVGKPPRPVGPRHRLPVKTAGVGAAASVRPMAAHGVLKEKRSSQARLFPRHPSRPFLGRTQRMLRSDETQAPRDKLPAVIVRRWSR